MITEDYVSFETSKLLKEKGFDWECGCYYFFNNEVQFEESLAHWDWNNGYTYRYSAPTLQMAMKWLREVYRLSIEPYYDLVLSWVVDVKHIGKHTDTKEFEEVRSQSYNSYEQACESAIKYCLENLI